MKKHLLINTALLVATALTLNAQKDTVAVKYANTITKEDLSKHLHVLASDEYGGRETGKESLMKAAEYISDFYKNLNIPFYNNKNYYQTYHVTTQQAAGVSISYAGKSFTQNQDFFSFPSYLKSEKMETEFIFLGYGIDDELYSDYKGVDVKDKIIIILNGEPKNKKGIFAVTNTLNASDWSKQRSNLKLKKAEEKGVKAVLVINPETEEMLKNYLHFIEGEKLKVVEKEIKYDFPAFTISTAMADALLKKSSLKLKEKINAKFKPITIPSTQKMQLIIDKKTAVFETNNVLAYIEGSDLKDELIIVSAHYDHIGEHDGEVYNGADDDGSGTVAIMEMTEAFVLAKKEGKGPRRSILILNVSGEEKGLLGSKFYTDNPVFPLGNTVANLNIDMIGRLDKKHADNENYVYIIGSTMLSDDLHRISEKANKTYTNLELDYEYNTKDDPNRYYYRSDHYNFAKNNIPVIFYFNGVHEDYHKATDTVDKIIFSKMEKITRLVFFTAWELANRNDRIKLNVVE